MQRKEHKLARILVTGGSGFIGAALVHELAGRGDRVAVLDLGESRAVACARKRFPKAIGFHPCDVSDWPQIAQAFKQFRPDTVVHCAAIVGVLNSVASPRATIRVNIEGSINVLEAMRLFDVKRMVNISSEEIYGHFTADLIEEGHPCRPIKAYGITKFAVEQFARDYVRTHGLEVLNVRTCWVYGPGLPRPRVPNILVDAALEGRPLHLESGADFRVDHVYVQDCVQGILRVLDAARPAHDAYHIATGQAPSLGEIVRIIHELVPGAKLSVGPGGYAFGKSVEAVRKGALDISRARSEFGYEPQFDIRRGLEAYVAWRRHEAV